MGYIGNQSTFTGSQNNKRISVLATAGQTLFTVAGGYNINQLDVYRNGIRLAVQRDFTATDGTTVTLLSAANSNDILEFIVFENFAVNNVLTPDGDQTLTGNLVVTGSLVGAYVPYVTTAGIATEAIRAGMSTESTRAGIATQIDGYLGVGVTGTNLNVTGIITANSFSGSLSGNATSATSATSATTATTATTATNVTVTANNSTNETVYPVFVDGATGSQGAETDTDLTYNPSTNTLTAGTFSGSLNGNATSATNLNNQAASYYLNYNNFTNTPSLATVATSGSYNDLSNKPTIPTNNNQLTNGAGYITSADGGNAATVDGIDSTSFLRSDAADQKTSGTLRFNDNIILSFGTGDDFKMYNNGVNQYMDMMSGTGSILMRDGGVGADRFTFTKSNGNFTASGNVTAYSDITLKKNIELIPNALDKVLSLRGVTYNRTDIENEPKQSGVIAQEVEKVLPEVVSTNEEGIKSVAYGNMVGLLIEAIKELKDEIETLKKKKN